MQICYWHARRAVKKRLGQSHKTNDYNPANACQVLDFVSAGFTPTLVPSPQFCPLEQRETLLEMFSRHYNSHPFIPSHAGTYLTAQEIYYASAR